MGGVKLGMCVQVPLPGHFAERIAVGLQHVAALAGPLDRRTGLAEVRRALDSQLHTLTLLQPLLHTLTLLQSLAEHTVRKSGPASPPPPPVATWALHPVLQCQC